MDERTNETKVKKPKEIIGCKGCASCSSGFGLCTYLNQIFDSLDNEEQRLLISRAHHRNFKPGETIFLDEDSADRLTILRSGRAKLNHFNSDGKEFVLDTLKAGDTYGEQSLFSDEKYNFNCVSLDNTAVCELYSKDIQEVMMKNPKVGVKLLKILGRKYSNVSRLIEINSITDAKQRIAGFILYISDRNSTDEIKMTREEMASGINLRTETVSRKLNELSKDGIISIKGHRSIKILDKDRLWDEYQSNSF